MLRYQIETVVFIVLGFTLGPVLVRYGYFDGIRHHVLKFPFVDAIFYGFAAEVIGVVATALGAFYLLTAVFMIVDLIRYRRRERR